MKKVILVFLVALGTVANAQIESGKIFVGGALNFNTTANKSVEPIATDISKSLTFGLSPNVGYCLSDNLVVGGSLGYQFVKNTDIDVIMDIAGKTYDFESKTGTFIVMPFARYYNKMGEKVAAFGELALPIGSGTSKNTQLNNSRNGVEDSDPIKSSFFGVQLSLGVNYFMSEKCALEIKWAGLNYISNKIKKVNGTIDPTTGNTIDAVSKTSNLGLNLDLSSISFGVKVFL